VLFCNKFIISEILKKASFFSFSQGLF